MTGHSVRLEEPATGPSWLVDLSGRSELHAAVLGCLTNGHLGLPGDNPTLTHGTNRTVFLAGCYGTALDGWLRPLPGPALTTIEDDSGAAGRSVLDLSTGVLHQYLDGRHRTWCQRLVSLVRPSVVAFRVQVQGRDTATPVGPAVAPPIVGVAQLAATFTYRPPESTDPVVAATVGDHSSVVAVAHQTCWTADERVGTDRVMAVAGGLEVDEAAIVRDAESAAECGFDGLLDENRAEWRDRWESSEIIIEGDEEAQRAIRWALFHLLSCAPTQGEATVGARGQTGLAYAGRVFWDTDVFVLPALAATIPAAARAVLQYRFARLDAAGRLAAQRGHRGARFPWESAGTGDDATPSEVRDVEGRPIPVWTGQREEHITADVAWAFMTYLEWSGDEGVVDGSGSRLLIETARYWCSRVDVDVDGTAHLRNVMGPDEYHDCVDDNAYTNNLVAWNLRYAARHARPGVHGVTDAERASWTALADSLVTGYDEHLGRHRQFTGFDELEPLIIGDMASPPVAADLLLGRDRANAAQVIKQPDVLMLHHVLPDEVPKGSLLADLDYYLPRTAHGSSLSPAVCAGLMARAGRPDEALDLLSIAGRIDLDDLTGSVAGGLHLATMGGYWQAVVTGFAGIRPRGRHLDVRPQLPRRWTRLQVTVQFRGRAVTVEVDREWITVSSPRKTRVCVNGRSGSTPLRVPTRGQAT